MQCPNTTRNINMNLSESQYESLFIIIPIHYIGKKKRPVIMVFFLPTHNYESHSGPLCAKISVGVFQARLLPCPTSVSDHAFVE